MQNRWLLGTALALVLAAGCGRGAEGDAPTASADLTEAPDAGAGPVDATDPIAHLQVIAGPGTDGRATPSAGLAKAQAYVAEALRPAGLTTTELPFPVRGQTANNLLAVRAGAGPDAAEIVLLSAHLDHLGPGYPGADDNGSGSAALVAIANRLAGESLDRSVAFLWTAGEELGLVGSAYFTSHPPATVPLDHVVQVLNLDAIAALDDTRFSILLDDTAASRHAADVIGEASRELAPAFARINQDLAAYTQRTDGYSFVRHGVPTIWVSEGLTNPAGGGSLMPRYHKGSDTVENLLAENGGSKLRRMSAMLAGTVEKLANEPPAARP